MLSLCALVLLACPQAPFDLDAPIQGTVRDEQGQAIARAKVTITPEDKAPGYTVALSSALWSQPLMPTFSGKDGSWVMPLTDLHRTLYGGGPGTFVLTVTAPGYQPWREKLVAGLNGFLGSDAVLHKLTAADTITLNLGRDNAGALVLVRRQIGEATPHTETFRIDKTGRVTFTAPRWPTPLILRATNRPLSLSHTARVLRPGYSTLATSIRPTAEGLEWSPGSKPTKPQQVEVTPPAGQELTGLRGLYLCPDDKLRWFDGDQNRLLSDPYLQLRLICADGMLCQEVKGRESIHLVEAAETRNNSTLYVVDETGSSLRDAVAYLWPITEYLALKTRKHHRVQPRRPRARIPTKNGKLVIQQRHLSGPMVLEVRAPGFTPSIVLDPRKLGTSITLAQAKAGELILHVTDRQGTAIDDVFVFLDDRSLRLQARPKQVMRTSNGGLIRINGIEADRHFLRLARRGYGSSVEKFTIEAGETCRLDVQIDPITPIRVITVDKDDKPVPFVSLALWSRTPIRSERKTLWSDSRGLLLLADTSVESGKIRQERITGSQFSQDLDSSEPVRLVVDTTPHIFLRTGNPNLKALRFVIKHRTGGSTSSVSTDAKIPGLGYFVGWAEDKDLEIRLGLGSGPPLRITSELLAPAKLIGPRLRELDQSKIVRRQRLLIKGPSPESLKHLRIEPRSPHHGGAMISTKIGNLALVDASNHAFFIARDQGEWLLRVMHPEFRPLSLTIDSATADDKPISIELVKGTSLTFEVPLTPALVRGFDYTLMIKPKKKGGYIVFAQDHFTTTGKENGSVTIRSPMGFQPGPYVYTLRIQGGASYNATVDLDVGVPRVVDLTANKK